MKNSNKRVIVAGAGPGGLMLACELALAGVPCTVLERRPGRSAESRALGLQARTLELLQLRDLAQRFTAGGNPLDHFRLTVGATRIDLRRLDTSFQQLSILPQSRTEELLEERAVELGATVQRGAEVLAVQQDDKAVTVRVRGRDQGRDSTWDEQAAWLVGCDGSHSTVRESLDIGFPGKSYPYNILVGDVRLARPPSDGMLIQVGRGGLVVAIDFGNGWWRMGVVDWKPPKDTMEPATPEELGSGLATIFGYDLGPHDPVWMTRFRFQNRHASTYRRGRVFLLGDAAHVHAPLGAQGLNLSMSDAMNLGWKLAAVVQERAPADLLASYERERRPIATRVLKATDAAIRVMMSQRMPVRVARRLVVPNVVRTNRGHQTLAGYISGLSWVYPSARHHARTPIIGRRLPDACLRGPDGATQQLFQLFHAGQFVLIDQDGGRLADEAVPWDDRLLRVSARIENSSVLSPYRAILCRPDGYCAWAGDTGDKRALLSALREWCGDPPLAATTPT